MIVYKKTILNGSGVSITSISNNILWFVCIIIIAIYFFIISKFGTIFLGKTIACNNNRYLYYCHKLVYTSKVNQYTLKRYKYFENLILFRK